MAKDIQICEGATVLASSVEEVEKAVTALAKDPHAPRTFVLSVNLHVHNEYPKVLYEGKETKSVADAEAEGAAAKAGFGPYDHEAFTAPEEEAKEA